MKVEINNTNSIAVTFSIVFPDEQPLEPIEYLRGIDKDFLIDFTTNFLTIDHMDSYKGEIRAFLSNFFCKQNNALANKIFHNILLTKQARDREAEKDVKFFILNPVTTLTLFELIYSHNEHELSIDVPTLEINIFKLYILLNERQHEREHLASTSTQHLDFDLQMSMLHFCQSFYQFDIINYDETEVFLTQFVKAVLLFEFLEKEEKAKHLLKGFLERFGCLNWEEYLRIFTEVALAAYNSKSKGHINIVIKEGENYERFASYMDSLALNDISKLDKYDFISIRSKPFYKIKDGVYRLIYKLFMAEKLFKGLYFLLNEVNIEVNKNKELDEGAIIKDLRPVYCDKFSEQILLYTILNRIFENSSVKYEGREIKKMGVKSEPDYYARKGKNIFLFESKDFYIKKQIKHSYDFNEYNEELKKRLYYEEKKGGKTEPGAVMQLIENIKKTLYKEFPSEFDSNYNYKEVFIYPIIVVHDNLYNTYGLNVLINSWFNQEIEKLRVEGYFTYHIKPITIIWIDSLLLYQDNFFTGEIKLSKVIDGYIKHTMKFSPSKYKTFKEFEFHMGQRVMPFYYYLKNYGVIKKLNRISEMVSQKVNRISPEIVKQA